MAVPRCPKVAAIAAIHRGGRPVTRTNRAPAASTLANAATVRSEIVPSRRMMVPSRSVATSDGNAPTVYEPNRAGARRVPCSARSADAAWTELDADPWAGRAGRLGHGVLPGALAAAAHDDEVPVPEVVPDGADTSADAVITTLPGTGALPGAGPWAQQQRPRLAERDDRDHGVLGRAAPDGVAVPCDAVPLVPVEAQAGRDERLPELGGVVPVQRRAARVKRGVGQRRVLAIEAQQPRHVDCPVI